MNTEEACLRALNYSGEHYISTITKTAEKYIISFCDQIGHDLFSSAAAIDLKSGDVYDYSPLDDTDNSESEMLDIPEEFISIKGKIISILLKNKKLDNRNYDVLDTLYEAYDLYYIKPYTVYSILNYYTDTLMDSSKTKIRDDAYKCIMMDKRSLNEIIEYSKDFGINTPEITALNDLFENI